MIVISTGRAIKERLLTNSFDGQIKFVDPSCDSDFLFARRNFHSYDSSKIKPCEISFLSNTRNHKKARVNFRKGFCVDNAILRRSKFNNFTFTTNDFCGIPYLIPAPYGPNFGNNETIKNETFNNKVFWSGAITHETRTDVLSFYKKID